MPRAILQSNLSGFVRTSGMLLGPGALVHACSPNEATPENGGGVASAGAPSNSGGAFVSGGSPSGGSVSVSGGANSGGASSGGSGGTLEPIKDFTLIAVPDTQFFVAKYKGGVPEMFGAQFQWIRDNVGP